MKKACTTAALIAACIAPQARAAVIGFTGPLAPSQFTTTVVGNLTGRAGGSVDANAARVVLSGGNDVGPNPVGFAPACTGATAGIVGPCEIRFVTTNVIDPFTFDWNYTSTDSAGAGDDLFGVLLDGVRTQLSDPGGALTQSGHVSVSATTSFGWYVNCTDCIEGAAVATVGNLQAGLVPEPPAMALLGLGLVAAGVVRSRRFRPAG